MFDAFINAGGNFIDTANNYTNGTAETLVGEFIHPGRGKYVIATKYTLSTNPKDPNSGGNHKKSLVQSLERSLKRPITISLGFTNEPIYSPFVKMLMFSEIGEKIDLLK
jgi:aryl-alcohol dehydrogenase-like predicted oxidoreductase